MAVIINEFEAVAEREDKKGDAAAGGAPPKIEPAMLRVPLHRIAARARRLAAH